MDFLLSEFRQKVAAKRIPKGRLGLAIGKSPSYISEIVAGLRKPDEQTTRRILFVFAFLDSAEMAGDGFIFDAAGIALLKREIKKMEKSNVRADRPTNGDASAVESEAPCAN